MRYVLGFDVGGTKIAAAAFSLDGERLGDICVLPTMAKQPAKLTLLNLKRAGLEAAKRGGVSGPPLAVGMGCPGPLNPLTGCLGAVDNLPNLHGFQVGAFIESELEAPLFLENDANCFALGEALSGAGRGCDSLVGLTVGTFFGCGIVLNGRIHSGASYNAGEVAYCPVGGSTYDSTLSGSGLRRFYEAAGGKRRTPKEIAELGRVGDKSAVEAWRRFGTALGVAVGTICAVIDPQACVIGGSVAGNWTLFEPALRAQASQVLAPPAFESLRIERASLPNAAVVGAAQHALRNIEAP